MTYCCHCFFSLMISSVYLYGRHNVGMYANAPFPFPKTPIPLNDCLLRRKERERGRTFPCSPLMQRSLAVVSFKMHVVYECVYCMCIFVVLNVSGGHTSFVICICVSMACHFFFFWGDINIQSAIIALPFLRASSSKTRHVDIPIATSGHRCTRRVFMKSYDG
ncbi:hypothetical protein F4810DRAFT_96462 [Camillea tinctor]|nr:hypothetical protein F4810DRAFT_96462 [Camillea tinctor]